MQSNKHCGSLLRNYKGLLCGQLLDLPGIIEGAKDGKGRGKQVIAGKLLLCGLFSMILGCGH